MTGKPEVLAEYTFRETDGEFWIDVHANRQPFDTVGPFATEGERQRAFDDLLSMMRCVGAIDIPARPQ
jgi:hypothetical protein